MLNANGERALAYVAKVEWVKPIEGADNIELIGIKGWTCIAKIGEFKENDLCVYFEIDSKLPAKEWSAFMEKRNYKVKTMKLGKFGVVSQGLALPLDVFTEKFAAEEDTDVTEILGVTYHNAEDNARKSNKSNKYQSMIDRKPKIFKNKFVKIIMRFELGRKIMFKLFGKKSDNKSFPTHFPHIHKTDEERVENMTWILHNKSPWIVTTKVDGTSSTYILERKHKKNEFYVLSRNIRQFSEDTSNWHNTNTGLSSNVYWDMAKKYKIQEFLQAMLDKHPEWTYVCIQGETAGPGLQGNPHKLKEVKFYGYNFIDSEKGRWNSEESAKLCSEYDIPWVPIISTDYILPDTLEELKTQADGPCEVEGASGLREGYVYRSLDGVTSFKNVSNKYLLSRKE